jgi:hypothetical protein
VSRAGRRRRRWIYARPLSDAERQQVEHYLAARYGISLA